ncbi:Transcription factor bHLH53 [Platanthera zijinensis]|uniref:Transcription factor bHLH53 n=1 Tax=Platanthera zijinensis TaxID=2320716 RepID=A0AAP0B6J6_9ASPA
MQELGRLIPGGGKMSTAEMLLVGQKYVQYLQAQISILELDKCDKIRPFYAFSYQLINY